MANIFQAVATYNKSGLGRLLNEMVFVSTANNKFNNFNTDFAANLGTSITGDLPPRFTVNDGLVVNSFEGVEQRVFTLTVNQAKNVNYAVTNEEQIFNMDPMDYMKEFGESMMIALANAVESNVAEDILSNTYRYFGDGTTPINSFGQLAQAYANDRDFGTPAGMLNNYIDLASQPAIINSGLNQFVLKRNDEIANSWELGEWNNVRHYTTNLLPTHTAGTLGNDGTVLTVVSTTGDGTAANPITAITFSGAGTDANAVKQNDLMRFQDGVSGQPNMRFRRFQGYTVSAQPVQMRATADATSSAGSVTIQIDPPLQWQVGKNQNINVNVAAGMQVKIVPSHRRGLIVGGNAFYVAMPRLPTQTPYPTSSIVDPASKVGMRMTYGAIPFRDQMGIVYDVIWGKKLLADYAMGVIYPL